LDPEQQFRVRRIIDALSGQASDDSPEQVAATLSGDPTVWMALLGRPEPSTRQTAARQLTAMLGEPIGVDPSADPATQQTQRDQLLARIEGK
jgi:phage gp37-like protein